MSRYPKLLAIFLTAVFLSRVASAQVAPSEGSAEGTRRQLSELLSEYPPTVTRVLQTDPALLTNKEYLAPYPALAAFVAKHPEIPHNATYFLGSPPPAPRNVPTGPVLYERVSNNTRDIVQDMTIALVLIAIATGISWIIRSMIEYRRWTRMVKTQTEIHSRLMDRLTSSEDLLAYIQSPAGRRFLEFAPVATSGVTASPTLGRILWSVQAGLVLGLAGVGLAYASKHIVADAAQPFFVLGVLGVTIGAGFILSAFASYIIARNMGLVHGTSETPPT